MTAHSRAFCMDERKSRVLEAMRVLHRPQTYALPRVTLVLLSQDHPRQLVPRFKIPKWMRYIAILLLLLLFSKVLEHFSESFKQVLHAADNFFKHGVENVAPFHLCAVFYRNILDDLSSSSQQGSASLGRQLPSLSARRFKSSERYSRRVRPASSQLRLSCSAEFP